MNELTWRLAGATCLVVSIAAWCWRRYSLSAPDPHVELPGTVSRWCRVCRRWYRFDRHGEPEAAFLLHRDYDCEAAS